MNSGIVRLDQMMPILITMKKHRLHLLLCFVFYMPKIIQLNLNYIIIDQCYLLTIFRRVLCEIQANQSNFSHLNINQSINVEQSKCDRNNKDMYSCFYESKKFFGCSM